MTVHQLGRITDRIAWNRMLSKGIQCLAGTIAQDDLIAKIGKEGMPEGKVVIQIQNKRNPDFSPDAGYPLQLQQLIIFIIIQIRQLSLLTFPVTGRSHLLPAICFAPSAKVFTVRLQ